MAMPARMDRPIPAAKGSPRPLRPVVERLNSRYDLGIQVPLRADDVQDSRTLRDADVQRQNSILQQLHLHSSLGDRSLQSALDRFHYRARGQGSYQVHSPPQATTLEDQAALQTLLLNVLKEPPRDRTQRRSRNGPQRTASQLGSNGAEASTTTRPCRGSRKKDSGKEKKAEATHGYTAAAGDPPQRWRIYEDRQRLHDAAESLGKASAGNAGNPRSSSGGDDASGNDAGRPRNQAEESTVRFGMQEPQEWEERFWSNDAAPQSASPTTPESSAMYSAVESLGLGGAPFDSQTTFDDDLSGLPVVDQEVAHPVVRRALSLESFGISEAGEQALTESFGLYDSMAQEQPPPGSPTKTDYSSIPDIRDLRLYDSSGDKPDDGGGDVDVGSDEDTEALVPGLQDRLDIVFPSTPQWLEQAPFPIIWEMTRIAMHCGVDLHEVEWTDALEWDSQDKFRNTLAGHPRFAGKLFPERASQLAWHKAMRTKPRDGHNPPKRISHYLAELSYNRSASGPLYFLSLRPLAVGLPHRLGRHFGCDRFLELTMPSHDSGRVCVPRILWNDAAAVHQVNRWLTRARHGFLGRQWAAFFLKDSDAKKAPKAKSDGPIQASVSAVPNMKKMYLFAEKGFGVSAQESSRWLPAIQRHEMLDWLLQYNHPENRLQPYLKLFSRIALGLSTTTPALVFEPYQIRHRADDLRSPATGQVMNDGIGRMSLSVVRKLRAALELTDLPTAVQGRLGCAKGMWVLDVADDGRADWIETYPSQRKWACDFGDRDHRTLEVCKVAAEVRSASLNSQFIAVLEAQAVDKARLRRDLGGILAGHLRRDVEAQRKALAHPMLLAAWIHETVDSQRGRVLEGQVPFLGGLPDSDAETIAFLLSGGFDPRRQTFLWDLVYKIQQARLETLKDKLNVPVGRSTYLFMAVDFLGVLEEGEVQVCFSTKFQAEGEDDGGCGWFSDTLLVNQDVLVARSPAHYTSDIQKVRAVYRPELSSVKDVIFFSSKGSSPLAALLSGGDYDGDMAWVCWDPRLVDNFANAPPPPDLDLVALGYMRQNRTTLEGLGGSLDDLLTHSFAFNMPRGLLGRLTKYKEELCYLRDSVGDTTANVLSAALSQLVDRAKQGISFGEPDFARLRRGCLQGAPGCCRPLPATLPAPAYQGNSWNAAAQAKGHVLDYLKFGVIKPVIECELQALAAAAAEGKGDEGDDGVKKTRGYSWDPDLAKPARAFEALAAQSDECFVLFEALKSDLEALFGRWYRWQADGNEANGPGGFRDRVLQAYQEWCAIVPRYPEPKQEQPVTPKTPKTPSRTPLKEKGPSTPARSTESKRRMEALAERYSSTGDRTVGALLQQSYLVDAEGSQWAQLRASQAYCMFYRYKYKMLWRLAGRQLQMIKGMGGGGDDTGGDDDDDDYDRRNGGLAGARAVMTPLAYAAMRPHKKTVVQMAARRGGTGVAGVDFEGGDDDA